MQLGKKVLLILPLVITTCAQGSTQLDLGDLEGLEVKLEPQPVQVPRRKGKATLPIAFTEIRDYLNVKDPWDDSRTLSGGDDTGTLEDIVAHHEEVKAQVAKNASLREKIRHQLTELESLRIVRESPGVTKLTSLDIEAFAQPELVAAKFMRLMHSTNTREALLAKFIFDIAPVTAFPTSLIHSRVLLRRLAVKAVEWLKKDDGDPSFFDVISSEIHKTLDRLLGAKYLVITENDLVFLHALKALVTGHIDDEINTEGILHYGLKEPSEWEL